jgi:hypothetical protein
MPDKNILSLHTLPVELVYHVMDNLNILTILYSMRNVCKRINAITDSYYRYQVSFYLCQNASFALIPNQL